MTPNEGKDSDSSDSRKTFITHFLTCSVDSFRFFFFFPSVIVVDFIGTKKSNEAFEILFFSVTFFIVINLCLYVGLLRFCEVFSFYFLFSFF